ncbi:MAG: fimbrillin family protein [Bacteroidaceae bacterium]|nr:fimbrillin family protein [Bacteroidaceae bacterium]
MKSEEFAIAMFKARYIVFLMCATFFVACSSEEPQSPEPADDRTSVNITTRAEDENTAGNMQAGLFMVNYQDENPDDLLPNDNYVNNQLLTWANGTWTTTSPIYWIGMETRADFYAYAPFVSKITDARKMPFSISCDQSTDEAFAQSDLLWGTVLGQSPTSANFELTLQHQLSRLSIVVTADTGFEEGELQASDVSVTIGGTKTAATFDLQTAAITLVSGSTADVKCHSDGDLTYTAILLPQQVPFSNLIQVDWQGNKYTLQNTFTLEARRQYTLKVKLKKTKSGFDIGIEGWDIIPEDFGGVVG